MEESPEDPRSTTINENKNSRMKTTALAANGPSTKPQTRFSARPHVSLAKASVTSTFGVNVHPVKTAVLPTLTKWKASVSDYLGPAPAVHAANKDTSDKNVLKTKLKPRPTTKNRLQN